MSRNPRAAGADALGRAATAPFIDGLEDGAVLPAPRVDGPVRPYDPLNVLKPVAPDVWIVDGPVVRMGPGPFGVPFPTRMTLLRGPAGQLFAHSPTELTAELAQAIAQLGDLAWLIAPNRLHHTWLADWARAYPAAAVYLAPAVRAPVAEGGPPPARLVARTGYPWDPWLLTLPVRGRYMTEVEFFHRPSRTLVLTDLFENFEADRLRSALLRWIVRLGGVAAPHGGLAHDLRATFPRAALREAVREMIAWDPERILLAHGRWIARDGAAELKRAFRWLIKG